MSGREGRIYLKTKLYKRIIIVAFLAVASLVTNWRIEACFRTAVFLNWGNTAGEWRSITKELDDIEGFRRKGLFDYNLVNPFELYAMEEYTFIDKEGNVTEEDLKQLVMPIVDKANRELDGNPTKIYVGHYTPHKLSREVFIFKTIGFFQNLHVHSDNNDSTNDSTNDNINNTRNTYWTIIVYKRARNPFWL